MVWKVATINFHYNRYTNKCKHQVQKGIKRPGKSKNYIQHKKPFCPFNQESNTNLSWNFLYVDATVIISAIFIVAFILSSRNMISDQQHKYVTRLPPMQSARCFTYLGHITSSENIVNYRNVMEDYYNSISFRS